MTMSPNPELNRLGLIAGKGIYPNLVIQEARRHGVKFIGLIAIDGETPSELEKLADETEWIRLGQIARVAKFFKKCEVHHAMMAGQVTPKRLFDLRPDFRALILIAQLKERNAETLFGAVADYLHQNDVHLLSAATFLDDYLVPEGHFAGPTPTKHHSRDLEVGWEKAKTVSALNIGQTLVLERGTVLAVEGFDGTNDTIRRGGALGKGGALMLKVSKPNQDMRFDIPVIGPDTIRIAAESGVTAIACEAKKTLLLDKEETTQLARSHKVSLLGHSDL